MVFTYKYACTVHSVLTYMAIPHSNVCALRYACAVQNVFTYFGILFHIPRYARSNMRALTKMY